MSTKRIKNRTIESAGILHIQAVVEASGCVFSRIPLDNDYGNDCYIEFFEYEVATSVCIFAQVKSGKSYKDKTGYKISTDKDHLEYWNNHTNPIVGIVYDDELGKAFWVDISAYLKENTHTLVQNSHAIRIDPSNEFSVDTFGAFQSYFIKCISEFKSYENYGRSLESFAHIKDPFICYDGLKSLYSNHRNKQATWYYIVSNFGHITASGIHRNILGLISNYTANPNVLWQIDSFKEFQENGMRHYIAGLIDSFFKEMEITIALQYLKQGVNRGAFSFNVYLVLAFVKDIDIILQRMAFDEHIDLSDRSFIIWLYSYYAQEKSVEVTVVNLSRFLLAYPQNEDNYIIEGVRDTLRQEGYISIG